MRIVLCRILYFFFVSNFLPRINLVNFRTQFNSMGFWTGYSKGLANFIYADIYFYRFILYFNELRIFCCKIQLIFLLINKHAKFVKTCYHKWTLKINQHHVAFLNTFTLSSNLFIQIIAKLLLGIFFRKIKNYAKLNYCQYTRKTTNLLSCFIFISCV